MSDPELGAIRQRKLRELQRRLEIQHKKPEAIDADKVLGKIFKGRAWEVFNSASSQFPHTMKGIKDVLVRLASSGRLHEVTGQQLYLFLRNLGLPVKLKTKIIYANHGKLKSLAEKMKENLRRA